MYVWHDIGGLPFWCVASGVVPYALEQCLRRALFVLVRRVGTRHGYNLHSRLFDQSTPIRRPWLPFTP